MKPTYAAETRVSPEKTLEEMKGLLRRFGADNFCTFDNDRAGFSGLEFDVNNRRCRFIVQIPKREEFAKTETGRPRDKNQQFTVWEKAIRSRWRSLALIVKAKLVAIEEGVFTFEQEFALHFVMANGQTVYEQLAPHLEKACDASSLPTLMPGFSQ